MNDLRRKHLLKLRRQLRPLRYLTAEYLGDGLVRFTCKECGCTHKKQYTSQGPKGLSLTFLEHRLIPYWNKNGGCAGQCPTCTRRLRKERYPL